MIKAKQIRVGLIQMAVTANPDKNLAKAVHLVKRAATKGARIICLPELFASPYFPRVKKGNGGKYAETIPGGTTRQMSMLAKKLGIVLIVPLYERAKNKKFYNTAVVISEQGEILGLYRKTHIPHDPEFYEKDYFEEGDSGYKIFKTKYANIAVLICYDQWFPEAARMAKLNGAEILFYPTAIGDLVGYLPPEGDWLNAWETIQRGHAIANSVPVAVVNRVGKEGKTRFWGQSFISDAFGKVLKRASKNRDEALIGQLDLSMNKFISEGWGFMRNRRPGTYRGLTH